MTRKTYPVTPIIGLLTLLCTTVGSVVWGQTTAPVTPPVTQPSSRYDTSRQEEAAVLDEFKVQTYLSLSTSKRDVFEHDNMESEEATLDRRLIGVRCTLPGNKVAVDVRLGQISWDPHNTAQGGIYDYGTAYGFGVEWQFAETAARDMTFHCAFEYNHATPDDRPRANMPFEGEIWEWCLRVRGDYEWEDAVFFYGLEYSEVSLVYRHRGGFGLKREGGYEEEDNVGLFGGARYYVLPELSVAAEITLIDRMGFGLAVAYDF